MINTDDIQTVVVAAFAGTVPGGVHPNRGPDVPSAYPYVVFTTDCGDAEHTAVGPYFQKWRVSLAMYVQLGSTVTVGTLLRTLDAALLNMVVPLRNASETVMQCLPVSADEEYDAELRDGRDILVAMRVAELYCQGDRTKP